MNFPRTLKGWKNLFWISFHKCPICHKDLMPITLLQYWGFHSDSTSLWCNACGGIRYPKGLFRTLMENHEVRTKENK